MIEISAVIITRNEERRLERALHSLAVADEIVVVDSGSTDGTLDIAREFTGSVHVHADWPGFGRQKNRALDYASGDWVLSLDADERVTPELRDEIEAVLARPQASGYEIPRLSSFCGRFMRHSGWYPDYVLRLFRRGSGRFNDAPVHEAVRLEGKAARLKTPLLHYSYRDFDDVLDKLNRYSSAAAAVQQQRGKRGGLANAVGHGLWSFMRTYFLRAGFLDGREGFMLAVLNAEHSYYRYLKLMLLHDRSSAKR